MTTTYTVKVSDKGTKSWYLDGKLHCTDGPAIEGAYGTKEWYLDGKLHRIDGPAIEGAYGTKEWYLDGKLHRVDGPAIECADGTKLWYLNDGFFVVVMDLRVNMLMAPSIVILMVKN